MVNRIQCVEKTGVDPGQTKAHEYSTFVSA